MGKKFLIIFAIIAVLAFQQAPRSHGPIIKDKNGSSTNWSGYAVLGNNVNDVKGSWVVPAVNCTGVTQNTYSSAWVGIDGDGSSTVEQLGTEQDCINGQPSYYAWYEMYPKPSFRINLPVSANQTMTAEVKYVNGNFQLFLNNTLITSQKSNKAKRASAEWVMEAPWSGGVLPLANFGTAIYSGSNATMGPISGSISAFSNIDRIDMVNSSGGFKDITSGLDGSGSAFTVQWLSSN